MEPFPKLLYKYQPCTCQSTSSLAAHKIWFSIPERFNDPFDCNFGVTLDDLSNECITSIIRVMRENKIPEIDLSGLFDHGVAERYLTNGKANSLAQERLRGILPRLTEMIEKKRNRIYTSWGVACFTTKKLDTLMWSHYADGHRGFCLEFDTSFQPFQPGGGQSGALRVRYCKKYPRFNLAAVFKQEQSAVEDILTTKGCSFRREKEYRIIRRNGNQSTSYDPKCLTAVYFGANMTEENQFAIASVLRGSETKFYKMKKSKERFLLTYESVYLAP